jgi:hypothetical protein
MDWVRSSQLDWYLERSAELEAEAGHKVPSLLFQHIIMPEISEFFPKAPKILEEKINNQDIICEYKGQKFFRYPVQSRITGTAIDHPTPPWDSDGEFDVLAARGDVMAVITGHDHANSFTATLRGVDMAQLPGTALNNSFGANIYRGATLFALRESKPWSYEREAVTYKQLAAMSGSEIGDYARRDEARNDYIYFLMRISSLLGDFLSSIIAVIASCVRGAV